MACRPFVIVIPALLAVAFWRHVVDAGPDRDDADERAAALALLG